MVLNAALYSPSSLVFPSPVPAPVLRTCLRAVIGQPDLYYHYDFHDN